MWSFADRWVKAVSDVTVGTVIVLVHVALADRTRKQLSTRAPGEDDKRESSRQLSS